MSTISERIKKRRKELYLKADDVADAIGVSRATLYRYENQDIQKIPTRILDPLAQILHTTPEYIMGWEEKEKEFLEKETFLFEHLTSLPIIGTVRAGVGGIAYEESLGEEYIQTSVLRGHNPDDFFWLRVRGDSMEPRLYDGDLVLVRKESSIDSGIYAVVLVDDEEGVVKRVTYDENTITLHSQNPCYPPRTFKGKEILRVRIVGRVIKSQSNF